MNEPEKEKPEKPVPEEPPKPPPRKRPVWPPGHKQAEIVKIPGEIIIRDTTGGLPID